MAPDGLPGSSRTWRNTSHAPREVMIPALPGRAVPRAGARKTILREIAPRPRFWLLMVTPAARMVGMDLTEIKDVYDILHAIVTRSGLFSMDEINRIRELIDVIRGNAHETPNEPTGVDQSTKQEDPTHGAFSTQFSQG